MSARRPPTAGTFARLAVASVIACAVLPEVADLAAPLWRTGLVEKALSPVVPPASVSGPRVMGAYHTADAAASAVDRFRFAAGSPFGEESPELIAVPDIDGGAARGADGAIPDQIIPAATTESAPLDREPVAPPKASAPTERHVPLEPLRPAPALAVQDQADRAMAAPPAAPIVPAADVPAAVVPDHVTTAGPPDSAEQIPAPLPPPATTVASPGSSAAVPAPLPLTKSGPGPAARGEPRKAEPRQAINRPAAPADKPSRARRQAAAADDKGEAAKPAWRPTNLNNWPE